MEKHRAKACSAHEESQDGASPHGMSEERHPYILAGPEKIISQEGCSRGGSRSSRPLLYG